jgi:hypothetical protein
MNKQTFKRIAKALMKYKKVNTFVTYPIFEGGHRDIFGDMVDQKIVGHIKKKYSVWRNDNVIIAEPCSTGDQVSSSNVLDTYVFSHGECFYRTAQKLVWDLALYVKEHTIEFGNGTCSNCSGNRKKNDCYNESGQGYCTNHHCKAGYVMLPKKN